MSRGLQHSGIRPPPPRYYDAVHYPISSSVSNKHIRDHKRSYSFSDSHHRHFPNHSLNQTSKDDLYREHVYQTLSCVKEPFCKPDHYYKNITPQNSKRKFKYIYSFKKIENGRPLYVLEAIPETLASADDHMGVKTYAQLEVVAADDHHTHRSDDNQNNRHKLEAKDSVMCGVGGVNSCDVMSERLGMNGGGGGFTRCAGEMIQSNGKAVILPLNGMVSQDRERLIVESILGDVNTEGFTMNGSVDDHGSLDDLPPPPSDIYTYCENDTDVHNDRDLENFTQALEPENVFENDDASLEPVNAFDQENGLDNGLDSDHDTRGRESRENTPLLQALNAQSNSPKHERLDLPDPNSKRKIDNEHECADSGYSDCNRLEFKEHVTDYSTDHVIENVIYSEPEYSSSDMSIKCTGDSPKLAMAMGKCQRTLKRTTNGVDHTVYELSPSDSFYSSADNVHRHDKRNSSIASSEGICRIGQSCSSLAEGIKTKQPFNRETSVSFKKPLVVGPKGCSNIQSPVLDMHQPDADVDTEDGEPLVTPHHQNSVSSIPSHLMVEDTRSHYRRKAADRGTLICASGGIIVVAIIVFLLIYFS